MRTRRLTRRWRACAACAPVVLGMVLASAPTAAVPVPLLSADGPYTYEAVQYSPELPQVPTTHRQQSQLWFHDAAWWALLATADGAVHVAELMPDHTWRVTDTVTNSRPERPGDVLSVGGTVYVVGAGAGELLIVTRLSYSAQSRAYHVDNGFPVEVPQGSNAATIALDSTGAVWLAFTTSSTVRVLRSRDAGRTWSAPFDLPTSIGRGEAASVVAFDSSVGVMWSDQQHGAFRFAVHRDGGPIDSWVVETALEGRGMIDDHLSVKVLPGEPDTVLAAVKTSQGDNGEGPDAPLILALRRAPDGTWSSHQVSTVGDVHTRPTLLLDRTNATAYVAVQSPLRAGEIYLKSASLKDLSFRPGRGSLFMRGSTGLLSDPTSTKQPVDARTGLVVLAVDEEARRYAHGEMVVPLSPGATMPGTETDRTLPTPPAGLRARQRTGDTLVLWNAAHDGEVWWPDADGMPVKEYEVMRDDRLLGVTADTAFQDATSRPGVAHTYTVVAVDWAGNRSAPSEPVRTTAPDPAGERLDALPSPAVALTLAGALLLAGLGWVQWRKKRQQRWIVR